MVEHHHKNCTGVLLQMWCPHHIARRLGCRVCCCQAGQERPLPGGAPHTLVEASKNWWLFSALQPSVVLTGRGNQSHCPPPCLQTFRLARGLQILRRRNFCEALDSSHSSRQSKRAQNNRVPPFPVLKCSGRKSRRPGKVRSL